MPSSRLARCTWTAVALAAASGLASPAEAQQQPQGFAVERFYPSAPGGGWFVMDALDMRGGLGGAMALSVGYARNPLRVTDGSQSLAVVSDQASTDLGFAITYDRFRFYLNLDFPLAIKGQSGTVGDYSLTGPAVDLGSNPDTISDARVGSDVRIVGGPRSRFRFGAGGQLIVPNGSRADYLTDGTFRGMIRALVAGDARYFTYAAHLGVHIRPLDDSPAPGSPKGSELLFGVAAGAKLPVGRGGSMVVVVGPEVYGATAFRSFFGGAGTAAEALLSGRLEGALDDGVQARVKLGVGAGIDPHFGAPEWRLVFGLEVFNHRAHLEF